MSLLKLIFYDYSVKTVKRWGRIHNISPAHSWHRWLRKSFLNITNELLLRNSVENEQSDEIGVLFLFFFQKTFSKIIGRLIMGSQVF